MNATRTFIGMLCLLVAGVALAEDGQELDTSALPQPGSVTLIEGNASWERILEVVTHPRCINCHVGPDHIPLQQLAPDQPSQPHIMAVNAGISRIGAEGLSCSTCHVTSTRPNTVPHAAPHTGMDWKLAPVEFQWVDKTSAEICSQMRDPARNGGRDAAGLIEHITHDAEVIGFITWGFNPGAGREPAPGGLEAHLRDMAVWTAAGMPCPQD